MYVFVCLYVNVCICVCVFIFWYADKRLQCMNQTRLVEKRFRGNMIAQKLHTVTGRILILQNSSMCMCEHLHVRVGICLYVYLPRHVSVYMCLWVYAPCVLFLCVCVCMYVCVYVCEFV